jgi:hypothetical protein
MFACEVPEQLGAPAANQIKTALSISCWLGD